MTTVNVKYSKLVTRRFSAIPLGEIFVDNGNAIYIKINESDIKNNVYCINSHGFDTFESECVVTPISSMDISVIPEYKI